MAHIIADQTFWQTLVLVVGQSGTKIQSDPESQLIHMHLGHLNQDHALTDSIPAH